MIHITCHRSDCLQGTPFVTQHEIEPEPVKFTPGVAGWTGTGAGLSNADLDAICQCLKDTASNIQRIEIELV